jgi:hypothetical protein
MKRSRRLQACIYASVYSLLVGCATGHPTTPVTSTTRTQRDTTIIESHKKSWAPHLIAAKLRYFIHDSSTISINGDTTVAVVPIESTMIFSVSTSDSNNLLIVNSQIDSFYVNSSRSTKTKPDTSIRSNMHMVASKEGRFLDLTEAGPLDCTVVNASSPSRIGEVLIALPLNAITVGDKWSDTVSTTSCRGRIALTHRIVRQYELLDFSSCPQTNAAKVRGVITDTLVGSSTESNNHLSAHGFGNAISMICIDANTGTLLESDTQSHLELTVTTTRGAFPFIQNSNTHIELR